MKRTPGAELLRPRREVAGLRARGGAALAQPALRLAQLGLERGDPLLERVGRPGADGLGRPLERPETIVHQPVGGARPSPPRCAASRSRCSARR